MNLDSVLQDPSHIASLADHDWWIEGLVKDGELTYDPSENYRDNNMKDELEIEWGHGTIEPNYSDEEQRVPAGGVYRNLPPEALGDAGPVIMFARDLMNRGFMGDGLQRQIKSKFDQPSIRLAAKGLHSLFELEGIIGCIAVDTRGYDHPKQAIAAVQGNPFKRFIKYAITEHLAREDYDWLPDTREEGLVAADSCGNAIDDFFTSTVAEDKGHGHKARLIPHCKQTMLPIYAGMGELDPSYLKDTLIEMMNVTPLTEGKVRQIQEDVTNNKYDSRDAALQEAFRWIDSVTTASKKAQYAASVDASEFMIESRDKEIELMVNVSMPELDIDPVNHCLQNQFDVNPARQAAGPLDVSIFGDMTEVILANQPTINHLDVSIDGYNYDLPVDQRRQAQAPIRIQEESNNQMDGLISFDDSSLDIGELDSPMEVDLDPMQAMDAQIEVDVFGGEMEFGLMAEVVAQDVSLAQHEDPMFVGGDFEFNERQARPGDLDIELGNSMEW
jgi:hypothetical protein